MKNVNLLLIIFYLFLTPSFISAAPLQLTFAYEDHSQPPYYIGDSLEIPEAYPGISIEMMQQLNSEQIQIKLVRMPWKRCQFALEKNQVQGIFNASYSKSRLSIGWYPTIDHTHTGPVDTTKRITTISYYLYKNKEQPLDWDGQSFKFLNGKIGAPFGYSIIKDLRKKGVVVEESLSSYTNLKKLAAGRLVGCALQGITADSIIKAHPKEFNRIEKIETPLVTKPYYLMLSSALVRKHPNIAKMIWNNVEQIRIDQMEQLQKRYQVFLPK